MPDPNNPGANGEGNPETPPVPPQPEEKKPEGEPAPSPAENPKPDENKPVPFHQDPAVQDYLNRQWEAREKTLRDELSKEFEQKFTPRNHPGDGDEKIPEWFGGSRDQWKAYKAHIDETNKAVEDRAYDRFKKDQETFQTAQKEANEFFDSEVKALEAENEVTVDRDKLIQTVIKYKLVDPETRRWNYRAAFEIVRGSSTPAQDPNKDRKKLADATNKDGGGGEPESKTFKTPEDFKKDRPW